MKNENLTWKKKFENLKNAKMKKLDVNLEKKLSEISEKSLAEKTITNRSIWKKEILTNYETEKTARRILRNMQLSLSAKVCKFAKLNDAVNFDNAIKELEKFYKSNLIDRSKFSNIDADKEKGKIIHLASELSQMK